MKHFLKDIVEIEKYVHGMPQRIVIFSHTHPDGDAVGSGLAIQFFLKANGHIVDFVLPDTYPDFLAWLPNADNIIIDSENHDKAIEVIENASCFIFVDLNSVSRISSLTETIQPRYDKVVKILIDHHTLPDTNFTCMYWDIGASSTSELIFELIQQLGDTDKITKEIAECLYVGIMTDTGSFSYSCNNPFTYEAVKYFIMLGIDAAYIHHQVYNTFTESRLKLLGYSLSEKLVVFKEFGGAYIYLDAADLLKYEYKVGDTEGLVNYTLTMSKIKFGLLLTEMSGFIKLSFRSFGNVNVNVIAKKYFDGGGHKNAAGAYFYGSMKEACCLIEKIICNNLN